MGILLHLAFLLARNRWWVLAMSVVLSFSVSGTSVRRRTAVPLLIVGFGLANFLGGPVLCDWILYRMGQRATGQIIDTYRTHAEIDDRNVVGYNVLIRDARGNIFASRMEDDEFNIFPPSGFSEPVPGESFGVSFLPSFPRDFIILTDDDSPWVRRRRCDALSLQMSDAEQRFDFAAGAAAFRMPYATAIDAYLAQGCAGAEPGPTSFRQDRARAVAGKLRRAE